MAQEYKAANIHKTLGEDMKKTKFRKLGLDFLAYYTDKIFYKAKNEIFYQVIHLFDIGMTLEEGTTSKDRVELVLATFMSFFEVYKVTPSAGQIRQMQKVAEVADGVELASERVRTLALQIA